MNTPDHPTPSRRRSRWIPFELAALGVLAAIWLVWPSEDRSPVTVHWAAGESRTPIEAFSTVPPNLPLSLTIELDRPMHVYVASHDVVRGTIAMFPSAHLRSDLPPNPLPAGTHQFPGSIDDQALWWHVGDGVEATSFFVIASEEPLPELLSCLAKCRQMGNAAFPKRGALGLYAPPGGMEATPPRHRPAHDLLVRCRDLQDPAHDGPMGQVPGLDGVLAKVLRVRTASLTPAVDDDTVRDRVEATFGGLEGALPAPPEGR